MSLFGVLLISVVVYVSSASGRQHSSIQSLLSLLLNEKAPPTVILLKSARDEKVHQQLADENAKKEDKHYWLEYLKTDTSASSGRLQSSLQTLLDLLSPVLYPVKLSTNRIKPKTSYLSDESDSEDKRNRHYWVDYLVRSQKSSVRDQGVDETPSNILNALRQRCQKVDQCAQKCPPKKKQTCQQTCSDILDKEDYCQKPVTKDPCRPKCGRTMPPYHKRI